MQVHKLPIRKTARYYQIGDVHADTREIWFAFHGYGQLARTFLEAFSSFERPDRVIVAPEGLNRFYSRGLGGDPVASWMTSEAREDEISDYVNYIEQLANVIIPPQYSGRINLIGFSQGVATCTRWMHESQYPFNHLFIYAGEIAMELRDPLPEKIRNTPSTYISGNRDSLLKEDRKAAVHALMKQLNATFIEFEGGHELKQEVLARLFL